MEKVDSGWRVKNSFPFKLKDKPGRQFYPLNLMHVFGFIPEIIIIEKLKGGNNWLFVRAVLTKEEIKKEEAKKLEVAKKNERINKPNPSKESKQ